jgi:hypothetical protein
MRWDRHTMTALGGIAALLIGAMMLLEDARPLFVPVIGMVGGIAAVALANHERLKLRWTRWSSDWRSGKPYRLCGSRLHVRQRCRQP